MHELRYLGGKASKDGGGKADVLQGKKYLRCTKTFDEWKYLTYKDAQEA